MAIRVHCPKCDHTSEVDAAPGTTVWCPYCGQRLHLTKPERRTFWEEMSAKRPVATVRVHCPKCSHASEMDAVPGMSIWCPHCGQRLHLIKPERGVFWRGPSAWMNLLAVAATRTKIASVAGLYSYPVCRYALAGGSAATAVLGVTSAIWADTSLGLFLGLVGLIGLALLGSGFLAYRRLQVQELKDQILAFAENRLPSSFANVEMKAIDQVPRSVRDRATRGVYAHYYRAIIRRGGPRGQDKKELAVFAQWLGIPLTRQERIEAAEDRAALSRDAQLIRDIAAVAKASPTALNTTSVAQQLKDRFGHDDVTATKVHALMTGSLCTRVLAEEPAGSAVAFGGSTSLRKTGTCSQEVSEPAPREIAGLGPEGIPTSSLRPPLPDEVRRSTQSASAADAAVEALRDTVQVEGHLEYIMSLLKRYKWDAQTQQAVGALLTEIAARKSDPRLFLGVVGEFSSGKSTFINALIRDDLLRADVLQGTTAAATVLSYGAEVDVEVLFREGMLWHRAVDCVDPPPDLNERQTIRQFIHRYTAEESIAQNVAAVSILHPTEVFRRGLVIVDTPGTNAENPRHIEVAGQALRQTCDAAIVVISADVPGSQSLMTFLREHLADVLHRCVFILNKADVVRHPNERERLLATITAVLKRELGLENPLVLPAAPQLVLDELAGQSSNQGGHDGENRRSQIAQFHETEQTLYRFLESNKTIVLLERLSLCLSTLLEQLQDTLRDAAEAYRRRHEVLEKSRIHDLAAFVFQKKREHLGELRLKAGQSLRGIPQSIKNYRESVLAVVRRDVGDATSTSALQHVVEKGVKHYMSWAQENLDKELQKARIAIGHAAESQHGKFKAEFVALYKSLATLDGTVHVSRGVLAGSQGLSAQASGHTQALAQVLQSHINHDIAGAGIGAVVGTVIFPGIGTVVGGIIGGIIAAVSGPSLDEVKRKVLLGVTTGVRNSFDAFESAAVRSLDESVEVAGASLCRIIDRYFQVYKNTVDEMTGQLEVEKARLAAARKVIQDDLGQIGSKQGQLERVRAQLRRNQDVR